MGKAQSKRSVDITTETKKSPEGGEEVTGKLEKIEDVDQKQVNGDAATPQEKNDAAAGGGEKKDAPPDEAENDKDLTTEKKAADEAAAAAAAATPAAAADGSGDQAATTPAKDESAASPKEDAAAAGDAAAATPVKEGEEISPLAEDGSAKKTKKPKKKWSFRNLSFGKKDKSKPKSESTENAAAAAATAENGAEATAAAATNGEAAETNQNGAAAAATEGATNGDAPKTDEVAAAAAETKTVESEKIENGNATEAEQKQMNGQKTPPTSIAEEAAEKTNDTAAVEVAAAAANATSPPPSSTVAAAATEITANEKIVSNGTTDGEKNGLHHDDDAAAAIKTQADESITKTIPAIIDEKPHQNGTNGDEAIDELNAATKTLQIEVKIEHPNDSNNSTKNIDTNTTTTTTTTTTTITNNSYKTNTETNNTTTTTTNNNNNNTTTNTTSNTIPNEQKTATNVDDQKTTHIDQFSDIDTTTMSNTTTTTTTNCSSNNFIEKCDEQIEPCKVKLEECPNIVSSSLAAEIEIQNKDDVVRDNEELPKEIDIAMEELVDVEAEPEQEQEQEQQQQPPPPPLPETAPPSQAAMFALKHENVENEATMDELIETDVPAAIDEVIVETLMAETTTTTTTTATTATNENITKTETIELKLLENVENCGTAALIAEVVEECEVVGTMSVEEFIAKAQEFESANADDDLEAQALNIVNLIEQELEKEEAATAAEFEMEIVGEMQTEESPEMIDMEICSEPSSSQDDSSLPLPPPPPPPAVETEILNTPITATTEENIIEMLNECIDGVNVGSNDAKTNEVCIDEISQHFNQQQNGVNNGDENGVEAANHLKANDIDINFDLVQKIDELNLAADNDNDNENVEQQMEQQLQQQQQQPTIKQEIEQEFETNHNTKKSKKKNKKKQDLINADDITNENVEDEEIENDLLGIQTATKTVTVTTAASTFGDYSDDANNATDSSSVVVVDKEMPTAKELKENAAAAEIKTQDLPVTCE